MVSVVGAMAVLASACDQDKLQKEQGASIQNLKNYALAACIAKGYQSKEPAKDALAVANGYKELGRLDIDAYNEAAILSQKFLARNYPSQSGEQLILMKCIDFYHSEKLDHLARQYAN